MLPLPFGCNFPLKEPATRNGHKTIIFLGSWKEEGYKQFTSVWSSWPGVIGALLFKITGECLVGRGIGLVINHIFLRHLAMIVILSRDLQRRNIFALPALHMFLEMMVDGCHTPLTWWLSLGFERWLLRLHHKRIQWFAFHKTSSTGLHLLFAPRILKPSGYKCDHCDFEMIRNVVEITHSDQAQFCSTGLHLLFCGQAPIYLHISDNSLTQNEWQPPLYRHASLPLAKLPFTADGCGSLSFDLQRHQSITNMQKRKYWMHRKMLLLVGTRCCSLKAFLV